MVYDIVCSDVQRWAARMCDEMSRNCVFILVDEHFVTGCHGCHYIHSVVLLAKHLRIVSAFSQIFPFENAQSKTAFLLFLSFFEHLQLCRSRTFLIYTIWIINVWHHTSSISSILSWFECVSVFSKFERDLLTLRTSLPPCRSMSWRFAPLLKSLFSTDRLAEQTGWSRATNVSWLKVSMDISR